MNKETIKNIYPLPRIEDLLDHLQGAYVFTKMDLILGYHQVRMHHSDIWKTTFKTKFGLYEWIVMPFILTNAPTTFMWLINNIFRPHLGKFHVVIYFDDILIFSRSWEQHLQHLCTVLEFLRQHQLQLKQKKSYFSHTLVHYLGFIVDSIGVCSDPTRFQAISAWPTPTFSRLLKIFCQPQAISAWPIPTDPDRSLDFKK